MHTAIPVTTPKENTIAAVAKLVNTMTVAPKLPITNETTCTVMNNKHNYIDIHNEETYMHWVECHGLCIHIQLGPDATSHACYKQTQLHPHHPGR